MHGQQNIKKNKPYQFPRDKGSAIPLLNGGLCRADKPVGALYETLLAAQEAVLSTL
jgi:hypothetical protein